MFIIQRRLSFSALLSHATGLLGLLASGFMEYMILIPSYAQQAIINMPSADLTPKGKAFVMNESFIRAWDPDTSWKTTNFFTYGLTDTTELAITTFGAGLPKTNNFTVAYGFKTVIPLLAEQAPKAELKLTGGYMLPVSKQGQGVGSYGYSHLSARLPKLKTRVSAGINGGTRQIFDRNVVCFIGSIEQPITKELTAVLEYYSGTHAFGGVVAGMVYHNHKHDFVLVGGWRFPNSLESGRQGLVLEVGKFVNLRELLAKKPKPSLPFSSVKAKLASNPLPSLPEVTASTPSYLFTVAPPESLSTEEPSLTSDMQLTEPELNTPNERFRPIGSFSDTDSFSNKDVEVASIWSRPEVSSSHLRKEASVAMLLRE